MKPWTVPGWYWWQPLWSTAWAPNWGRPALLPSRQMLASGLRFPPISRGGGPIYGSLNPFQFGPAPLDPGALYFRAGNPIGGPSEAFRGVSANRFPSIYSIQGGGAPLSPEWLGLAGTPIE